MAAINDILERMQPISLEEMLNIRLMDRMDTKFAAPVSALPHLLEEMLPYFRVQVTNGKRIAQYGTQYLDTPDLQLFVMHHNGKLNRQKIRIRTYSDSDLSFLEVKNKNNKGRTSKKRVQIPFSHIQNIADLNEERRFLDEHSLCLSNALSPSLSNEFQRITLVNQKATERITIDSLLTFVNYATGMKHTLEQLMILELKQDGWQHSNFRDIVSEMRIKSSSFSKYCMGTVLTNPHIKYNRFKSKWVRINKLIQ
jgi:hypothetical protein